MSNLIKKINYLEFTIDHPEKKNSQITILEDLFKYESKFFSTGKIVAKEYEKINPEKLQDLMHSLNRITFQNWQKKYTSYKNPKPIVWNLYLQYNNNKIIAEYFGMNEFPISTKAVSPFHLRSSTSYTPEFKILLNALNKILGKKNFFI